MNSSFTLAIMLLVGSVLASGPMDKTQHRTAFVRNGTIIDPPHSMPWLVSILHSHEQFCTGSIIGKRHVLTAAHCNGMEMSVAVGAHDLNELGEVGKEVKVEKFEVFSDEGPKELSSFDWYEDYADRDIAIITLAEDVLNDDSLKVEKAMLGAPSDTDCRDCTGTCNGIFDASGWGSDPISPETASFPKTITKRCVDCDYSRLPTYEDQNTCAESDDNNFHYDVCGGDSGGPLTVAGTSTIVGIVELGESCMGQGRRRVGVYQDVLKPVVQSFITKIVPDVDHPSL